MRVDSRGGFVEVEFLNIDMSDHP
ncbi:uncharacterized protein METZ01_LOCUS183756 [marine metagenome]|uniref:Uncharacterized protein n=1 Tax=marine metagenome TaxID=408172 RepID=A0A382CYJ9_9ZZZZ